MPSVIARHLPSAQSILLVWFLAGVVSLFGALALAELTGMMPATGGQYVLLSVAYGPLWSNALSVLLILILTVINYRATQGGASRWPLVWAWRSSHCFTCWRTRRFSTFLRSLRLPRRTAWERRLHSERWDPRIHFTQTRYRLFLRDSVRSTRSLRHPRLQLPSRQCGPILLVLTGTYEPGTRSRMSRELANRRFRCCVGIAKRMRHGYRFSPFAHVPQIYQGLHGIPARMFH